MLHFFQVWQKCFIFEDAKTLWLWESEKQNVHVITSFLCLFYRSAEVYYLSICDLFWPEIHELHPMWPLCEKEKHADSGL